MHHNKKAAEGFTLVEVLVALAIFGILLGVIFGLISSSLTKGQQETARDELIGELTYAGEYMVRHLRTAQREGGDATDCMSMSVGETYHRDAVDPGHLYFKDIEGVCREFFLEFDATAGVTRLKERIDMNESFLTSAEIDIESLEFEVINASSIDEGQPLVTMYINARGAQGAGQGINVEFQTSVSARSLDL